jgi:nicotinamidase-related amidase
MRDNAITKNTALLIIDVQLGLDAPQLGTRNNPDAESNMAKLLAKWRENSSPVIHVKHNSTEPNSTLRAGLPGNDIKDLVQPRAEEPLFEKCVNSAFIGTKLQSYLEERAIQDLMVVGLTTDHCVSTSVRMAANLGFNVWLVEDGTATFDRTSFDGEYYSAEQMHAINLASLNGEFCTVLKTADVLSQFT